jgi:hypothetical protein
LRVRIRYEKNKVAEEGIAVKFYEQPEIEIQNIASADVISTSPVNGGIDSPLTGIDPDSNLIP